MKVRVYYNGYKDIFFPQWKGWFLWHNFMDEDAMDWACESYPPFTFSKKEAAIAFLEKKHKELSIERYKEDAARFRAKKSGVVFQDTWDFQLKDGNLI